MIDISMKNHLGGDNNCNIGNLDCPTSWSKEWQVMLGSHLVLVTYPGGLEVVLNKTNRIGDIKQMFSVVICTTFTF